MSGHGKKPMLERFQDSLAASPKGQAAGLFVILEVAWLVLFNVYYAFFSENGIPQLLWSADPQPGLDLLTTKLMGLIVLYLGLSVFDLYLALLMYFLAVRFKTKNTGHGRSNYNRFILYFGFGLPMIVVAAFTLLVENHYSFIDPQVANPPKNVRLYLHAWVTAVHQNSFPLVEALVAVGLVLLVIFIARRPKEKKAHGGHP